MIDEGGEVKESSASRDGGQRADDKPGDAARIADLGHGAAFHLDHCPPSSLRNRSRVVFAVQVLVAG